MGRCVGAPSNLGEFVIGSGEADVESFDFAEPAVTLDIPQNRGGMHYEE